MLRKGHTALLSVLVVALVVAGCTTTEEVDQSPTLQETFNEPIALPTPGTGGDLIPIDSDNVAMAGYDASRQVMTVLFDEGRLYEYYEVPVALWKRFVAAQPDPWSTVGYPELVRGGYGYQRIG